ncbi:MAG: ATP12 family protein, partial [Litorimonas sp.]
RLAIMPKTDAVAKPIANIKNKAKGIAKRFYKDVSVAPLGEGYVVLLDGRQLKTPRKKLLLAPNRLTADLVAAEWNAQGEDIIPVTMPVTRLVNVAIEMTPENRPDLVHEARKYAGTDLLCYRSDETRLYLEHQAKNWDPILDWAAQQGVTLETTLTLKTIAQDPAALDKIADYARGLDDLYLTLFVHLVATFGSSVLAMAVMESHLTGQDAFELSRLDEIWQIKHWGQVDDAKDRTDAISADVVALCKLLEI